MLGAAVKRALTGAVALDDGRSCLQVFRAGLDAAVRAHILTHPGHLPAMAADGDVLTHPWNGSPQPRVAARSWWRGSFSG